MTTETNSWFPRFENRYWIYQSFLVLPTLQEYDAQPGAATTAKKWARGRLSGGPALQGAGDGYTLEGTLSFGAGVELAVTAQGVLGSGNSPATFEATGTTLEGPLKGAIYQLVGWVFPDEAVQNGPRNVMSVRGAVRAVRGPDTKPELELGGMPVGTVGTFFIEFES